MGSREEILEKLSHQLTPFRYKRASVTPRHIVPNIPDSAPEMQALFIKAAEKLHCEIHSVLNEKEAIEKILALVKGEKAILGWDFNQLGLDGLEKALTQEKIRLDRSANPELRYGITGVDAALSATGSIVLISGAGKNRAASLLPTIHIALVRKKQIVNDLESWVADIDKNIFKEASNIVVISGPSKTADIAMELVMGMHGPQEVHLILMGE